MGPTDARSVRSRVVHGLLGSAVLAGLLPARTLVPGPVRGAPRLPAPHILAVAPSAVALEGAAGTAAQGAEGGTTGLGTRVVHRRAGALREGLAGSGAGTARAAPRPTGRPGTRPGSVRGARGFRGEAARDPVVALTGAAQLERHPHRRTSALRMSSRICLSCRSR